MASSGAEQDRYASHFDSGKLPSARLPARSGAEQDIYGSHLDPNGKLPSVRDLAAKVTQTSGAEQDVYGGWFGGRRIPVDNVTSQLPQGSGAEQDRLGAHFEPGRSSVNPTAIGLLQSSILPSFGLHAGLGALAYGVSRYTDTAEGKDWLWPAGMTANAWWSAIGSRVVYDGLSIPQAWSTLNYSEKLLLTGVSAWGLRLFYRIASRRVKRGSDDPRYAEAKKDPKFWNKAFFSLFLPEAVAQTLISLPFTLPFRATVHSAIVSPPVEDASLFHNLAVFFFSAGFALEVIADSQLESQKKRNPEALNRDGVWSIVRHPNYLGDALIHASFPLLLLGAGLLHPIAVVGPVANYVFLRYVAGDKQNEASQEERYKSDPLKYAEFSEYRKQKNSFWPSLEELQNKWTWIVVAAGAGGVVLERGVRMLFKDV